jgi:hypothetical protein
MTESLAIQRHWTPVRITVLESPSSETLRLAIERDGRRQALDVPRSGDFAGVREGEQLPGFENPMNPKEVKPGRGGDLWGPFGVVIFFMLCFAGIFAFLLRVGADAPAPPAPLPAAAKPAPPPLPADPLSKFRRHGQFGGGNDEIALRYAPRVWQANIFWSSLGILAALGGAALAPGEPAAASAAVSAGLLWTALFLVWAWRNRSFELHVKGDRLEARGRAIPFSSVKLVSRRHGNPGGYRLLDGQGRTLLLLDDDMLPQDDLARAILRIADATGKPVAED